MRATIWPVSRKLILGKLAGILLCCASAAMVSHAQTLTTLHNFTGPEGNEPADSLILARDGNYYGTTVEGGATNFGAVFKMTPSGTVTVLYSFCSRPQCADGETPTPVYCRAATGISTESPPTVVWAPMATVPLLK